MSINRVMLRLAAVCAVSNFYKAPWPTLAGRMVFDSKVEPIENFKVDTAYPTIVVYTDYDKNHVAHQSMPHTERTMTVTFELIMAVMERIGEMADDTYVMRAPQTDSELESSLDIMEFQLFESLRANNSAANVFRTMAYGMDNVVSRRGATTEGGTKIAARQVTYEARVIQELSQPMLPAYMTQFLQDLEDSPGMELVAPALKAVYTMNNNLDAVERLRRTMGWTEGTLEQLGYPLPGAPLLPPLVTWLDQHGNPL